jgi:ABC-type Mn2+/Zn2+ transport system permease subunit
MIFDEECCEIQGVVTRKFYKVVSLLISLVISVTIS